MNCNRIIVAVVTLDFLIFIRRLSTELQNITRKIVMQTAFVEKVKKFT